MHRKIVILLIAMLLAALSTTALADHNSRWGEGWANMPNDIHNTRIETRGDNRTFRDFVRFGNGADSVNRFATEDETRGRKASAQKSRASGSRGTTGVSRQRGAGRGR